ncbi:hypothetical protein [Hyphomicrobium sp. DY-1]|uniref:hypothetical protein n=1 Tax=Hyphomicrobium sp. DY-1 TaxID=3075650 RepID=UPI0039C04B5D
MIDANTGLRIPSFLQGVAFDPVTLTVLAVGGALLGGAVQAVGAIQQGQAQAKADNYNAAVADQNAEIARRNASAVRDQTNSDVVTQAREQRKQLGLVRATYGANGLDFSGTALDVFEEQSLSANYDLHLTQYKGNLRAIDYEQQAVGFNDSANLSRMSASAATSAGYIGAASAAIGGVTSAATTRLRLSGL